MQAQESYLDDKNKPSSIFTLITTQLLTCGLIRANNAVETASRLASQNALLKLPLNKTHRIQSTGVQDPSERIWEILRSGDYDINPAPDSSLFTKVHVKAILATVAGISMLLGTSQLSQTSTNWIAMNQVHMQIASTRVQGIRQGSHHPKGRLATQHICCTLNIVAMYTMSSGISSGALVQHHSQVKMCITFLLVQLKSRIRRLIKHQNEQ